MVLCYIQLYRRTHLLSPLVVSLKKVNVSSAMLYFI